jgi:glc operon protein GlcG
MTLAVKKIVSLASLAFLAGTGSHAWATGPTLTVKTISESGAQRVIRAAEHEAEKLHAPCAIAVVDASGILVAFVKMDGVRAGSSELAIGKARTSALLQRPSAETEDNVNKGRTAFVTAGFMTLRGGEPLKSGEEVVGAVGIAGLNKDNDVAIAQAAAAVFAATSNTDASAH